MIRVNVFSDSEGNTRKIELKGHAGYDDYGKDIVCASASALVLNMANSVEQFTDDGFDGNVEEETGHFTFRFTGDISKESKLLMDSLFLVLRISKRHMERNISKFDLRRCKSCLK